jgi:hypothetical protein
MSGIRLRHPALRAGEGTRLTFVVELPQPYPVAKQCPACLKPHANKAIHLRLDANGEVIVSREVYAALQTVPTMAGLELVDEVSNPPAQWIGAVAKDKERIVDAPLSGQPAAEIITPARTRFESRDRLLEPFKPLIEAKEEQADREATKKLREQRTLFT